MHPAGSEAPPPGTLAACELDAAALDMLRQLDPFGKTGVMPRVFLTYRWSLARLLAELGPARAVGDLTTVFRVVHTLKSSSASIGAKHLAELCAAVEQAVRLDQAQDLSSLLDSVVLEAAQADRAVCQLLSELPPSTPT